MRPSKIIKNFVANFNLYKFQAKTLIPPSPKSKFDIIWGQYSLIEVVLLSSPGNLYIKYDAGALLQRRYHHQIC